MKRLLAVLAALVSAPALAQTQPAVLPPETAVISPGGVDMVSGRYVNEATDLSMGSEATAASASPATRRRPGRSAPTGTSS